MKERQLLQWYTVYENIQLFGCKTIWIFKNLSQSEYKKI